MTVPSVNLKQLRNELIYLIEQSTNRDDTLKAICQRLTEAIPYYDWVGFYLVDPYGDRELVLGPYMGDPTDHTRIPFGKGICGQAADREETFLIQDVSEETNYLACSPVVKSEIVVPIFKDGKIVGELDIDSHRLAPFTDADRSFLENICRQLEMIF